MMGPKSINKIYKMSPSKWRVLLLKVLIKARRMYRKVSKYRKNVVPFEKNNRFRKILAYIVALTPRFFTDMVRCS